jgi:hypothetical protein
MRIIELRFKKNRTEKETKELIKLIREDTAKVRKLNKILEMKWT